MRRNQNATKGGLWAARPRRTVYVPPDVGAAGLAEFAQDLGDAAIWLAEALAAAGDGAGDGAGMHETARATGLYAAVAQELWQAAGELGGVSGIKPAPLGGLGEEAFETLMLKQEKALSLILSQCKTAWARLKAVQEVGQGLIDGEGRIDPTLTYLAGHMRTAKRMMRDLAANRAWQERGRDGESDLTMRLLEAIRADMERAGAAPPQGEE